MKHNVGYFVLILGLLSLPVEAARSTGGGNIVFCKKSSSTPTEKIQLLDYYEGELLYDMTPAIHSGKDPLKALKSILTKLKNFDKTRAENYRIAAEVFLTNTKFVNKIPLPPISDYGYIPLDPDCEIQQVAVQNLSKFARGKKYTIREDLWKSMSAQDQAGLMLHEIVYAEAMDLGQRDSVSTRYFTAAISAEDFEEYSKEAYNSLLGEVGFGKKTKTTTTGAVFTRDYSHPKLGEAWKDPSGMIWGDTVKKADGAIHKMNQPEAVNYCHDIGAKLPSREDFVRLFKYMSGKNYTPQILPNLTNIFWSSSVAHDVSFLAYTCNGLSGDVDSNYRRFEFDHSVRCVVTR